MHNAASEPGASCTVVRIRHRVGASATGSGVADDSSDPASDVDPEVDPEVDVDFGFDSGDPVGPVRRDCAVGRAPVSPVGGA